MSGALGSPKSSCRPVFMGLLLALVVIYGLFALVAMFLQRGLIYFPTRLAPNQAEPAAAENGFGPWRNRAGQIIGWKLPARSSPTGSVLITHGNAGCAIDRDYLARPIHDAADVDVFVLEYPGYGVREGSPVSRVCLLPARRRLRQWTARGRGIW